MKRTLLISSFTVLVTLLASLSFAVSPVKGDFPRHPLPHSRRYVRISVSPKHLDLGTAPGPGVHHSPGILTVHVEANCPHGGVVVHVQPLVLSNGECIPLERLFVRIPRTNKYVSLAGPVNITGPMRPGVYDFEVRFRWQTVFPVDAAGTYTGRFVFTVQPGRRGRRQR